MTTLNNRLQLALLNRKKGRNILEKGFTLVELMIVIVIVGILSAVALPNFLNQTKKAKATEAQSQVTAAFKNAQMVYVESPSDMDNTCATYGLADVGDWTFACTWTVGTTTLSITPTNSDTSIVLSPGTLNTTTGLIVKPAISG